MVLEHISLDMDTVMLTMAELRAIIYNGVSYIPSFTVLVMLAIEAMVMGLWKPRL